MKRAHLFGFLLPFLLLAFAHAACSLKRAGVATLPVEAARSFAEARVLERDREEGWRARAREAALRAASVAPDWVAPQRMLDDIERASLLGPEALARRRGELERARGDAALLYLVGRLEGRAGTARLEAAARADPALSWARHGLAWNRFLVGDSKGALRSGRSALERARGSFERGFFAISQARYLLDLDRAEAAVELLAGVVQDMPLEDLERTGCRVWLARCELACDKEELLERGFWRAVELLEGPGISVEERDQLADDLLANLPRFSHPEALAVLEAALAADRRPGNELVRARVLLQRGAGALAGALLERSSAGAGPTTPLARALALERGAARETLEAWLGSLPARVLSEDGLPRESVLRALVLAARAADDGAGACAFGQALLDAGWFAEAQGWSQALARFDPGAALALDARAAAGRALLGGIHGLLERVDSGKDAIAPAAAAGGQRVDGGSTEGPRERRIADLDQLLGAMQPLFDRYHTGTGGPPAQDLVRSPRFSFGPIATVIHPGPVFSRVDEQEGRGPAGANVGGLAAELAALGRFGIFGRSLGDGPDGTILRRLATEWRSGEHLGVPFAGLVVWCQGIDVPSRPARQGGAIVGAAVHEGYWIDIEGVRDELARMGALEREFLEGDPGRLSAALAVRGPRLSAGAKGECARWMAPLGESERVRLAVLSERARAGRAGGERITFDELLDLAALHEEGHLTDRTRFWPLSRHWWRALGLAFRAGLSPRGVARALEYRAQLVALCDAADPRLPLADCLAAAEEEGDVLPHGEAYRELVVDLLAIAARELERLSAVDPEHYLVYQLHFLGPEEVRRLARALASEQGLLEE